ncbi:hypothetical protein DKT75_11870 [Leucothrix arctica]|uniref:Uncharacterized protein n=2 Tax=Leucothrix arctica TaxID=1481894 RepID=A0A317CAL4_9GAMM|nr:hypothetical protein DKT75_11870 [Leucothrix arctica]
MHLQRAILRLLISVVLMLSISSIATANECLAYAHKSVEQNSRNLFNQCGFHGSQWSSDFNRWNTECNSMSGRDRRHRLQMREGFLSQCPTVAYSGAGRNYQRKLSLALLKAVQEGSLRRTELLVQAGANLSAQPQWLPASPLYTAIKSKSYHLVRFLLRNGAKSHLLANGEMNMLSLLLQSQDTNYAMFEFLLQNGANPNLLGKQADVDYPLVIAAAKGDFRSADLLLRYKADPNLYLGRSALQLAVEQDHYPLSRALIQRGANPNLGIGGKRCDGIMALDLAFRNAQERVVDLLMDNHALAQRECH